MDSERIFEIIRSRLECKRMSDDPVAWNIIENEKKNLVPVSHAYQFVLYQNEYFKEYCDEYINCSIILYNKKEAIGIWPLSVSLKEGRWRLSSWDGDFVLPPILLDLLGIKGKRKIYSQCFEICDEICRELEIDQWVSKESGISGEVSLWIRMLLERKNSCQRMSVEAWVDLSEEQDKIFSSFRKSYKSCITKGERLWDSEIINRSCSEEKIESCFHSFEKLHIEVAGRRTRTHETWEKQCCSVKQTNDFAVLLYDKECKLVGASLYNTSGSFGYYGVGAYKRELFEFPLAHVSQWKAIKYMKEIGLRWYHLGTRFYEADWNEPTSKEISIGHFKEGFANRFFPSFYVIIKV